MALATSGVAAQQTMDQWHINLRAIVAKPPADSMTQPASTAAATPNDSGQRLQKIEFPPLPDQTAHPTTSSLVPSAALEAQMPRPAPVVPFRAEPADEPPSQALQTRVANPRAPTKLTTESDNEAEPHEFERIKTKLEALEDQLEFQGLKGFKISGALDPVFVFNRRQNTSGVVFLNNFDAKNESTAYTYDNSFFGLGLLEFQKDTRDDARYKLSLGFGKSSTGITNGASVIHEASMSIPLSDLQTRLIAGILPDFSGYEQYFSHQQPLISHNLFFDHGAPGHYTAAGIELTRGKWLTKLIAGNMDATRYGPAEKAPAVALRVDYAKGEFKGWGFATQHGQISNRRFSLLELDSYLIRGDLTLQGQIGGGGVDGAAFNGGRAQWGGFSGLIGYRFKPRYQFTARLDSIANGANGGGVLGSNAGSGAVSCVNQAGTVVQAGLDCRNGYGPGMVEDGNGGWMVDDPNKGVNRQALTLGLSYLVKAGVSLKAEIRKDRASGAVFYDLRDSSFKNSNSVFLASIVTTF